jgi:Cu/Zn superoxide dismutase
MRGSKASAARKVAFPILISACMCGIAAAPADTAKRAPVDTAKRAPADTAHKGPAPQSGQVMYMAALQKIPGAPISDSTSGKATMTMNKNNLMIKVNAAGLAPGKHEMHIHARKDMHGSTCPQMSVDINKDGIIDGKEGDSLAGSIHIPLTENPLDTASETYPSADPKGNLTYSKTIAFDKLESSLRSRFGLSRLAIDSCVIEIHGIAPSTNLPASVQSEKNKPAQQTIPVLCGKIMKHK